MLYIIHQGRVSLIQFGSNEGNQRCITLYLTLGYPTMDQFFRDVATLAEAGMDILEVGIPVDDPALDGKIIADTHRQAIEQGFSEDVLINALKNLRLQYPQLPLVMMSYYQGIEQYRLLEKADLYDALLCPDQLMTAPDGHCQLIQIYHEEMTDEMIQERLNNNQGFAYVMSGVGTTGGKGPLPTAI